jgi:transposase
MASRRKFTEEFKRNAARLVQNRGNRTVADVADDLGIAANQLHRWVKAFGTQAQAKPEPSADDLVAENRRLRKQVERLEMERTILKKAAAFFAKESE